jgi:sarcosine oxidase subunit beta
MKSRAECVIIGGGVVGTAIAYYLAKNGMTDTVLVEAEYLSCGATGRCGGGIRQQWSTEANTQLAIESVRVFSTLEDELDADIEFLQGGYLVLAYTEEDETQFLSNVELQQRLGLDVVTLSPAEITARVVPELNTDGVRMATYCPSDASANPFLTTLAYANAARRLGVEVELFNPVSRVLTERGRVTGVETSRGTISAPIVVNVAGCHSVPIAATAGVELPITPLRRQILVTEPLERFFDPMVISFSFGIYFRQAKHGSIIGGFQHDVEPRVPRDDVLEALVPHAEAQVGQGRQAMGRPVRPDPRRSTAPRGNRRSGGILPGEWFLRARVHDRAQGRDAPGSGHLGCGARSRHLPPQRTPLHRGSGDDRQIRRLGTPRRPHNRNRMATTPPDAMRHRRHQWTASP